MILRSSSFIFCVSGCLDVGARVFCRSDWLESFSPDGYSDLMVFYSVPVKLFLLCLKTSV